MSRRPAQDWFHGSPRFFPPRRRPSAVTFAIAITVAAGAAMAAFVAGLAGFGTGLVALGFWLHVIDPLLAAPLVVFCSVVAHIQSLITLRRGVVFGQLWPILIGGVAGVPLGVVLLNHIDPTLFRGAVGVFLIFYATVMLAIKRMPVIRWGGRPADGAIGFGGGIMGGIAGLSGPLPTIWCGLKGWDKDRQRAAMQTFNLTVLGFAFVVQAAQGVVTREVGTLILISLPCVLIGAWLGTHSYGRISDRQFRALVLWLLLASGVTLTISNLL